MKIEDLMTAAHALSQQLIQAGHATDEQCSADCAVLLDHLQQLDRSPVEGIAAAAYALAVIIRVATMEATPCPTPAN